MYKKIPSAKNTDEVTMMSKKGMKRPQVTHTKERNTATVPELQGKAKSGKENANPIIAGTISPSQKVYHNGSMKKKDTEPSSHRFADIFTDLAEDNLNNDQTAADLQDKL